MKWKKLKKNLALVPGDVLELKYSSPLDSFNIVGFKDSLDSKSWMVIDDSSSE